MHVLSVANQAKSRRMTVPLLLQNTARIKESGDIIRETDWVQMLRWKEINWGRKQGGGMVEKAKSGGKM